MAQWYIEKAQSVHSQKEKEDEIIFYTKLIATSDWPVGMHIALTSIVGGLNISLAQECQRKYG